MKAKILVLFASQYDMKGDDGNVIAGTTVQYLQVGENFSALESDTPVPGKPCGTRAAKATMSFDTFNNIMVVPGIYDAEFELTVSKDGKPMLNPINLVYSSQVEFSIPKDEKTKA